MPWLKLTASFSYFFQSKGHPQPFPAVQPLRGAPTTASGPGL